MEEKIPIEIFPHACTEKEYSTLTEYLDTENWDWKIQEPSREEHLLELYAQEQANRDMLLDSILLMVNDLIGDIMKVENLYDIVGVLEQEQSSRQARDTWK